MFPLVERARVSTARVEIPGICRHPGCSCPMYCPGWITDIGVAQVDAAMLALPGLKLPRLPGPDCRWQIEATDGDVAQIERSPR